MKKKEYWPFLKQEEDFYAVIVKKYWLVSNVTKIGKIWKNLPRWSWHTPFENEKKNLKASAYISFYLILTRFCAAEARISGMADHIRHNAPSWIKTLKLTNTTGKYTLTVSSMCDLFSFYGNRQKKGAKSKDEGCKWLKDLGDAILG